MKTSPDPGLPDPGLPDPGLPMSNRVASPFATSDSGIKERESNGVYGESAAAAGLFSGNDENVDLFEGGQSNAKGTTTPIANTKTNSTARDRGIVIGETQERVERMAVAMRASGFHVETIVPVWPQGQLTSAEAKSFNRAWLNQKIDQGYTKVIPVRLKE